MKNWGDFSSDDDSDFESIPVVKPLSEPPKPGADEEEDLVEEEQPEQAPPTRVKRKDHVLPEKPPYTAYVGNLSFKIKTGDELGQKVAGLVQNRLGGPPIVVTRSRIALDRDGNSRGFGYVEVETLDMLKAILELDDGQSMIAGRPINLDAASPPQNNNRGNRGHPRRSSSGSNFQSSSSIDGSQFRGGRYSNNNNEQQRKPSFKRQNSEPSATTPAVPLQRPSLKLKPRSQSVGLNDDSSRGSKSDIFGGAKARDHNEWTSRRQSLKSEASERRQSASSAKAGGDEPTVDERRKSERKGGRGGGSGRGDGRGGRGDSGRSGRGGRSSNKRSSSTSSGRGALQNKKQNDDKQPSNNSSAGSTRKQKEADIKTSKSTEGTSAPANRFAGLFDDDDSD